MTRYANIRLVTDDIQYISLNDNNNDKQLYRPSEHGVGGFQRCRLKEKKIAFYEGGTSTRVHREMAFLAQNRKSRSHLTLYFERTASTR